MAHIWTLFEKLCAIWGLFNSLSMGLGAQSATGCGSDCAKPVHGGSCVEPTLTCSCELGELGLQSRDSDLPGFGAGSASVQWQCP